MAETDLDEAARNDLRDLRARIKTADSDTLRLLLTGARTHYAWQNRHVSNETLRKLYEIASHGPTSQNQQPMRLIFIRDPKIKSRLIDAVAVGNRPKVQGAPVTAIIAYDTSFFTKLVRTFPHAPQAAKPFEDDGGKAAASAFRNGTLQGAWLIIAARSLGLDAGPLSGFDAAKVKEAFFPDKPWVANFLCNLGYGDETAIRRKLPRLDFDEIATIL